MGDCNQRWATALADDIPGRLLILSVLAPRARHGYELSKLVHSRSGGQLTFHIDSLYPLLYRLEERGVVRERADLDGPGR